MTDERTPEGGSSPGHDSTTPQPTGGWTPPPDTSPADPWTQPPGTASADTQPHASSFSQPASESTPPPTPPPAYVPPPAYAPPPQPYSAQPAVAWGAAPAAPAVVAGRSGLAMAAGIGLLVFGVLLLLIGLLFLAVAGMVGGMAGTGAFDEIPGMPPGFEGAIGGFVVVLGIIVILYSLLYIIGGIGVLRSRGWGRVLGIVVGIITGLFLLAGLTSPSDESSLLVTLVLLGIHVYVVIVLAFFWRSRTATA
jgi:hypothetical protein